MAFKFGLETVLKHRKRLEEMAQRDFMEAQAAVDAVLQRLESMYQRMDEVRAEIENTQKLSGRDAIAAIQEMEKFLIGQKVRIEHTRQEARELLMIAEEKQEALIEAAREKKVLVKLKEKRFAEYKEWLARVEAKALDDQAMMNSAWGKR